MRNYHWPGRPDGVWLHSQCEAPWFDFGEPLRQEGVMTDATYDYEGLKVLAKGLGAAC